MKSLTVHGGSFGSGKATLANGSLRLPGGQVMPATSLVSVVPLGQHTTHKMLPKVGWGAAGGILLGPVGALAGVLAKGRKHETSFSATFKDGTTFVGSAEPAAFAELVSAVRPAAPTPVATGPAAPAAPRLSEAPLPGESLMEPVRALSEVGWSATPLKKAPGQRHELYIASGFGTEVALAYSNDPITDYSADQMLRSLEAVAGNRTRVLIGRSVGETVKRRFRKSGVVLGRADALGEALSSANV